MHAVHSIAPVYDANSTILILGSFPSVKSREGSFFYHHPQNRFWKVLAALYSCAVPASIADKKSLLLHNHIALWDVVASCDIDASSDSSIQNVIPNDLSTILFFAKITSIYTNGNTANRLYKQYIEASTAIVATCLPSTSPASARYSLEHLIQKWQIITQQQAKDSSD